jgi:DNA-binding GntR family transcriptional regulator
MKLGPAMTSKAKTRSEGVYNKVRIEILACRLRPGARLKIQDLCQEHQVSNGAVREALSRLASEGLVLLEPQKGFRVMGLSREELIDLTEARIQIETICLRLAIASRSVDWESGIVASFYRLSKIAEREPTDPLRLNDKWVEAHAVFHGSLVAACPVNHLLRIRTQLYEMSERYRRMSVPLRHIERDVYKEHSDIKDAVLAGKVALTEELMRLHLSLTTQILLDADVLYDDTEEGTLTHGAASAKELGP